MNRSERRHFRQMAESSGGGEKGYLKLFDLIARQKEYDEAAIKRDHAAEGFVRNLSSTKHYLNEQILKSLRIYHADLSPEATLHDLFRSVEILMARGLTAQAEKMLRRADRLIEEHDEHIMRLHLNNWENSLLRKGMDLRGLASHLAEERDLEGLDRYRNFVEYGRLSQQFFIKIRLTGLPRTEEELAPFRELIAHPLLQDESRALTFRSKAIYHDLRALWSQMEGNETEELDQCERLVELIEAHPDRLVKSPNNYLASLVRLAHIQIRSGERELFNDTLEKLRSLPDRLKSAGSEASEQLAQLTTTRADNLYLSRRIADEEYGVDGAIEEIEGRLAGVESSLSQPHRSDYWHNLAVFCFSSGAFERSLVYAGKIVNETNAEIQPDRYSFARMLSMMLHLELGNYDVLEGGIRSLERFLKSREITFAFEKAFLRFLKRMLESVTEKEQGVAYRALLDEVRRLEEDPYEARVFRFLDVAGWIEGKLRSPI